MRKPERKLFLARPLRFTFVVVALAITAVPRAFAGQPAPVSRASDPGDKSTPRRAFEGFVRAARSGDMERAAQFLDTRALSTVKRTVEGPSLAHDLFLVIDRKLAIDASKLSDDPEGDPSDGPGSDVIGTIELEDEPVAIAMTRAKPEGAGQAGWLFSKTTVAMIPALYAAYGEHFLGDRMPPSLTKPHFLGVAAWQWIGIGLTVLFGWWGGVLLGALISRILESLASPSRASWDDALAGASRGRSRWVLGLLIAKGLLEVLHLPAAPQLVADRITTTLLILAIAGFLIRLIHLASDVFTARLPDDTAGELRSRGVKTQLLVARRISSILIGLIAVAAILIQFEFVRAGLSLLASAGIVGVVVGFAAQRSLAGMIAGIQLSITQPIRIDDVVVIEGESGTVEQINLTFVVVRIWDGRRLIVPISRFFETPFQNHSKLGLAQLGTVFFKVDPTTPVARVRAEVERVVRAHPKWDKRQVGLRVTDADDKTITLRALVSASNPDNLFELRCDVREAILAFLQGLDGGRYLPRVRIESHEGPSEASKLFTEPPTAEDAGR